MNPKESITIRGTCELVLFDEHGNVKERSITDNGITNLGFDKVSDLLGASASKLSHIGIGWGVGAGNAFDPAQTDLQGASKDRKACAYSHTPGTKSFTLTATWGPNEPIAGTAGIEEVGTFDALSGGVMFSRTVRPILNKLALDTLQANYVFTLA